MKWHRNESTIDAFRIGTLTKPRCNAVTAYDGVDDSTCGHPAQFTINGQQYCTLHGRAIALSMLVGDTVCD